MKNKRRFAMVSVSVIVVALLVVGIYLILASCCIMYMFSKIMKEKYEKEKLLYISNTDALTGCLNRHAYETDINKLYICRNMYYMQFIFSGTWKQYIQLSLIHI